MIKLKKKRLLVKYLLILIILNLKNKKIHINQKKNSFHILLLINYFTPSNKINNVHYLFYLNQKNSIFYKLCLLYLTIKNKLENQKILIKRIK